VSVASPGLWWRRLLLELLAVPGGPGPTFWDHRIEFEIVQQLISPPHLSTASGHHAPQFPAGLAPYIPPEVAAQPATVAGRVATPLPAGRRSRIIRHTIRRVTLLEVRGPLSDVIEELDHAIARALAESPRGVVCDLTKVPGIAGPDALEVLAAAGRHVRDWPGIPVAVACPDERARGQLRTHVLGAHLIVTASLFTGITSVLATPTLAVRRLRIAAHPTAPRAAREFVARTLQEWRLGSVTPVANLVVSELVTRAALEAGTDIDVSVVWHRGALRLTVRDHGPAIPGQPRSGLGLHGQTHHDLAALSRAFGSLRTADGGKIVWVVLDAARQPNRFGGGNRPPVAALARVPRLGSTGLNSDQGRHQPSSAGRVRRPPSIQWWQSRQATPPLRRRV